MELSESSTIAEQKHSWMISIKCMKERLKLRCEEASFEGIREMKLYHGLKLISSAPIIGNFLDICYCDHTKEYLVLDTSFMIHRFSIQGKPVQPSFNLSTTMAFTRFIWFPETKVFAGFAPHDDLIWILEPSCKLIQIVRNEFRVENIFYTPYTNEMLVIGTTKATRFPMDHKEQTLNSWKTVNISDSSFGPTWVLELSSLIQHDPEFLRLAGSYLTTLYVIPLTSDKDEESNVPVKFLARRINSMETAITVLYFHPTSQWIITGDQRGSICAWNLNLECMMNCPTGHQKAVKIITGHPSICGFISCAEDDIIQAWSCNLREKIESFSELGEVSLIAINSSASSVAAVGTKLSCFQMHQLYTFYSPLTSNPVILFSTTSPIDAVRVIIFSADKIVRILSSSSGKQLNIHILPITFTVVSIAHSDITDRMYVLGTNGIVVASTKTNPMEIEEEWDNASKIITCLLVYDHYEAIRTSAHEIENLPPKYRLQISYNEMNKEEEEHISDASEPIDQYLEIEEQILHPVSSVPLGSLDPTIEAPSLDQIFKEQICMQLKYRDEDIKRIQENILHAKKVVKMKTLMEHLDWERHIAELLGVSSKTENESSPHDIANYAERYEKIKKVFNKSQRSRMIGCSIKQFSDREKFVSEISGSSLNLGGFVPNSLVIKIADGRNKEVDQLETHQPMEKRQIKYVYPSEIYLTIDSSTSKDSVKHTHQDSLEGVL
ncbi:uncharacterized protein [Fopius arisanus]|uniref:Uncharacterized protein isoform X6 n=1 Tax=Fopius arisanus TaxID=64838 RepID=A0A9R1TSK2_9HYME|nr:PREDICTED: uncharacterized protein LOC105273939 isoform X6 [Fopius arisanus]